MATHAERIATLEQQVRELTVDVKDLHREVHGPGNGGRPSVRRRLHVLEHGSEAAITLERALRERAQAETAVRGERFGRREKVAALAISLLVAAAPYVLFFASR